MYTDRYEFQIIKRISSLCSQIAATKLFNLTKICTSVAYCTATRMPFLDLTGISYIYDIKTLINVSGDVFSCHAWEEGSPFKK